MAVSATAASSGVPRSCRSSSGGAPRGPRPARRSRDRPAAATALGVLDDPAAILAPLLLPRRATPRRGAWLAGALLASRHACQSTRAVARHQRGRQKPRQDGRPARCFRRARCPRCGDAHSERQRPVSWRSPPGGSTARACCLLRRVRRRMVAQGPAGPVGPRQVVAGDCLCLGERLHGWLDEARVVASLDQHVY